MRLPSPPPPTPAELEARWGSRASGCDSGSDGESLVDDRCASWERCEGGSMKNTASCLRGRVYLFICGTGVYYYLFRYYGTSPTNAAWKGVVVGVLLQPSRGGVARVWSTARATPCFSGLSRGVGACGRVGSVRFARGPSQPSTLHTVDYEVFTAKSVKSVSPSRHKFGRVNTQISTRETERGSF